MASVQIVGSSGSTGNTVKIHNIDEGTLLTALEGNTNLVRTLQVSNLVAASDRRWVL